ncbi:DNA cytosine methyltransferase [Xanthomonas sp. XNM01]|uniref:DNA cytosine methyltransferase n=1 Tax=Xanthomonas sp. XNM01 TaxID=2769289 RepID=UPI00178293DC|nr:DNA cytosine methyltransferase [Xanthomonas sp. XNM01]MBD9368816.1 DNA cytosine methyltransferase [Xanthomonas sp. XNM01]
MADGNSFALPFQRELVVDLFAGGGGASMGIGAAYREPDIAVNHNAIAVAVHRANHPRTKHLIEDVFNVDPLEVTRGQPVALLWASPDCRHHSKAKGGAPRNKRIRGLAWIVVLWGLLTAPRQINLENVEEFIDWCPLDEHGKPIADRRGETFRAFIAAMTTGLAADHPAMAEIIEFLGTDAYVPRLVRGLGYLSDWREIRACDRGAPTIRKRLYVKFRRDGKPITWAPQTHAKDGAGGLKPWRTAAECIDFNLPAQSIFGRNKDLALNTCKRVAKGLWRYVLAAEKPYIVGMADTGADPRAAFLTEHANASSQRVFPADEPLRTQVAQVKGGHFSVVAAHITKFRANSVGTAIDEPMHTITAGGDMKRPAGAAHAMGLVSAHLMHLTHHDSRAGYPVEEPFKTITAAHRGEQAVVQAHFLEQANGGFYDGDGRGLAAPMSTICTAGANQRLVSAYLVKYYGTGGQWQGCDEPMHTIPTKDRMGLVQAVKVRADLLPPDQMAAAKRCAAFLHEYLPEHFPEPVDAVLVGDYVLTDITLRMLVPAELARAQGFHPGYILDRGLFETAPGSGTYEWRPISKTDQVRLIGNSVCPDVAEAEVRNDLADLIDLYQRIAA